MTRPTNVIDYTDPDSNLFGIVPCPHCGSAWRYVSSDAHATDPETILCVCGFKEKPASPTPEGASS